MMKIRKYLAAALAATMVMSSALIASADTTPGSGSGTGDGTKEGHVNTELADVTLPTIAEGSKPFSYIVDPERLVKKTGGEKYEGKTFSDDALEAGVYFSVSSNDYDYNNESDGFVVTSRSSVDVDLTVKVELTSDENTTDIAVVDAFTQDAEEAELLLKLQIKDTAGDIIDTPQAVTRAAAAEQTVTIEGKTYDPNSVSGNDFELSWDSAANKYKFEAKDGVEWNTATISLIGQVNNVAIEDETTAPNLKVTWSWTTEAATSPAVDVTKLTPTAKTVTISNGTFKSAKFTKPDGTTVDIAESNYTLNDAKTVVTFGAFVKTANVGGKVTITFNDDTTVVLPIVAE